MASSKASDYSAQRSKRLDQGMGRDVVAASVVTIRSNLARLRGEIQSGRLKYIKKKMEANGKLLQRYTCTLFNIAADAKEASRGSEGGNILLQCTAEGQSRLVDSNLARNWSGEREVAYTKLPLVDRIPQCTTWIFLDKNQRMAEDQSVAGRRRIYYGKDGNEALVCSDTDDEIPEPEAEKHLFTEGEDQLIWRATQEHGLSQEVVNILCQFVDATPSEIKERSNILFEKNEKCSGCPDKTESQLSLDKTTYVALDSYDSIFCRRCLVFDCRLHGYSQNLIFPSKKQPYGFELYENKRSCGDQCYLQRRERFQEMDDDGHNGCPIYATESRAVSQTVDTNVLSESDDLNREEDNIKFTTFGGISRSKLVSSVNTERGNRVSGDASETENLPLSSLAKHKISNYGPSCRDHSPGKRQKAVSADIPSASSILNKHWTPEIGYTRLESKESGGHQLPSLDDSNKKFSNNDGGTENVGRNSNKVSSTKNLHNLSRWSALERDLYFKGIEIFGKNSCLIAYNLLSGLKTCMEVANYMYSNGAKIARRSLSSKTAFGDFAETEQDYVEQDMATRTRIGRRRGHNRKPKYIRRSSGHPTVRKSIGEGKRWHSQYTPCECQQMCDKDCPCVENGTFCEKYCGCSKICKNKFRGCHCAKSQCRSRYCPCFAASRECDPDVCKNCWVSCGDGSLGESPAKGDGYQCANMKLLLKQRQRILLGRSDIEGWGAFIKNPVHKNDYLGEYTGELISHEEADRRGKIYDLANSSFLFDLNDQYVVDAYRKGDKMKFANHSYSPNCYAKVMMVAGDHRVGIYAKEHIEASEELFYDYHYGPDQTPAWGKRLEGSKKDVASSSHRRAHKAAR